MTQDPREVSVGTMNFKVPVTDVPQGDASPTLPKYMNGWRWEDMAWRDNVGIDPSKILLEALRRAVDIRDQPDKSQLRARPVMLVDVLNQLCEVLGVNGHDLWKTDD